MNKELLISAVLLTSPAAISSQDIKQAIAQTTKNRQNLVDIEFRSPETLKKEFWVPDANGDYQSEVRDYYIQISFIGTDSEAYDYDGEGAMEYEVLVKYIGLDGATLEVEDHFYFAKRLDENTFSLFNCDSTANCSDDYENMVFHIFNTPSGRLLKFKQSSGNIDLNVFKKYYEVK